VTTLDASDTAIWAGTAKPHGWIHPRTLEVRCVDVTSVQPCPGNGPHVAVAALDVSGWVQWFWTERRSGAC
jgi:hypothetical protein